MERKMTCIVCPMGCELTARLDEEKGLVCVTGHTCARGEAYARSECTAPTRTLTTTVALEGGGVLPVKSAAPIPKEKLAQAMKAVNAMCAPRHTVLGQVLLEDLCETGVALVATADAD